MIHEVQALKIDTDYFMFYAIARIIQAQIKEFSFV